MTGQGETVLPPGLESNARSLDCTPSRCARRRSARDDRGKVRLHRPLWNANARSLDCTPSRCARRRSARDDRWSTVARDVVPLGLSLRGGGAGARSRNRGSLAGPQKGLTESNHRIAPALGIGPRTSHSPKPMFMRVSTVCPDPHNYLRNLLLSALNPTIRAWLSNHFFFVPRRKLLAC